MPIRTYHAHSVTQLASAETPFDLSSSPLDHMDSLITVVAIFGTAVNSGQILARGSQTLVFSDWRIQPSTVVGVELMLTVSRLARVQDRVIQFHTEPLHWLNDSVLWDREDMTFAATAVHSRNLADLAAADHHVYGGPQNLWGTDTHAWTDPTLALHIDLQPHSQYPSSQLAHIRHVQLRLHTM